MNFIKQPENNRKVVFLTIGLGTSMLLLIILGASFYILSYKDRVLPNVYFGETALSGMTQDEVLNELQEKYEKFITSGVNVEVDGSNKTLALERDGASDPDLIIPYINANLDELASDIMQAGRRHALGPFLQLILETTIEAEIDVLEDLLIEEIEDEFIELTTLPVETSYEFTKTADGWKVEVKEGAIGTELATDEFLEDLQEDAKDFEIDSILLEIVSTQNPLTYSEAFELSGEALAALSKAPYKLIYTDQETGINYSYRVTDTELSNWIEPGMKDGMPALLLGGDSAESFLDDVKDDIDSAPVDARFSLSGGTVSEFLASRNGREVLTNETLDNLLNILSGSGETEAEIVVNVTEPDVKTNEVNNLGIEEILGVGVSDFSGSPNNRIKNIQHGADKLNGLLIPPGESISLVESLKPFTLEDGYLPELVIKGDEIKPEVGGGLCQIGTTAFRAVMNSGLRVDQRRNHSLVVGYYNDPSNGNPGTDATLYDPAPDFVFSNDTENHILLMTDVDVSTSKLIFTFWGKNDGRKGYYTPPTVEQWIPYGDTRYTETENLPPGEIRCQEPHTGAVTSFDYIVENADGTKHKETFSSRYRPLPRICLVGAGGSVPGTEPDDNATEELSAEDAEIVEEQAEEQIQE